MEFDCDNFSCVKKKELSLGSVWVYVLLGFCTSRTRSHLEELIFFIGTQKHPSTVYRETIYYHLMRLEIVQLTFEKKTVSSVNPSWSPVPTARGVSCPRVETGSVAPRFWKQSWGAVHGLGPRKSELWAIGMLLLPPPRTSAFPLAVHKLANQMLFIYFVLLTGKLKKYSDNFEMVLLHKNEKLSIQQFCDIVPQLQSLRDHRNCSHSNKRSLMKVF